MDNLRKSYKIRGNSIIIVIVIILNDVPSLTFVYTETSSPSTPSVPWDGLSLVSLSFYTCSLLSLLNTSVIIFVTLTTASSKYKPCNDTYLTVHSFFDKRMITLKKLLIYLVVELQYFSLSFITMYKCFVWNQDLKGSETVRTTI